MSKDRQASREEQRQFWRMVFETHQASGLTIKPFCQNEGISEAAFYALSIRLNRPLDGLYQRARR